MTNREKLIKMSVYDLLRMINNQMPCFCIIQALGDENKPDICDDKCNKCIENWLNEEAE